MTKPYAIAESGLFADPCILKTIDSSKITWSIYPSDDDWAENDYYESYCADGDGLVTIKHKKCGCYSLYNEIEYLASFKTLEEALEGGQMWLANEYPWVFDEARHHNEQGAQA